MSGDNQAQKAVCLQRTLDAIGELHALAARESNTGPLLERACQSLTTTLGCRSAWIALLDADGGATPTTACARASRDGWLEAGRARLASGRIPACGREALAQDAPVVRPAGHPQCADCPFTCGGAEHVGVAVRVTVGGRPVGVVGAAVPVSADAVCDELASLETWTAALAFVLGAIGAVEAARRSERRFREVVEQSSEVFYRQSATTGRFEYVSPRVEALLGYTAQEMTTMDLEAQTAGIHPDDLPGLRTFVDDLVRADQRGETRSEREFRLRTKRGDYRWTHGTYALIRDEAGVPREIVGALTDITARKRAEADLEFQAQLLATIQDLILATDLDGRITYANDAECRTLGRTREELLGSTTHALGEDPRQGASQDEIIRRTRDDGEWRGEVVNFTTAGDRVVLDCRTRLLRDAGGSLTGMVGISTDITERKRSEEERNRLQALLAHAQKLESVGRLAGGVAHDFNNMLGVILGHVELALLALDPDNPLREGLIAMRDAAQRSANLTRQLLAFARKQPTVPKVLDLNEAVEDMLGMLRRLIGEDIDVVWKPGHGVGPVRIDPGQIDQILANLCVNARDAISGPGRITIETSEGDFADSVRSGPPGAERGRYAHLSVSDSGCGMDEATLARLFEPFFTTKPHGKGTGLGLATVYGIVRQNGGFVEVESRLGRGTTFGIYLPRHAGEADSETPADRERTPATGRETILLVEDESANLQMTKLMLERQGYTVLAAGAPGEAVLLARRHRARIDLLVTDVVMPEMNGRELARQLLAIHPEMKLLFVSGYSADVIGPEEMSGQRAQFLGKPFSLAALSAKVREAIGSGS